jgi:colanic acid/amylovoran biosynthesis glycosyltransferase
MTCRLPSTVDVEGVRLVPKIGYMTAEFPGQTYIWVWREIVHLREWGTSIKIFSTRRPSTRDRARHAFAPAAEAETTYLWPMGPARILGVLFWALTTRPIGLARCVGVGLTLPVESRPRWRKVLPLVLPACFLAREVRRHGVTHLHSHTCANSAILCMMARRLVGVPFSMTLNADIKIWGGAMCEKFEEAAFTIAITQSLLDQIRRDFPTVQSEQALLGRIGVDTRKWVPYPRPQWGEQAMRPFRVMTVARLHKSKGHDVLIQAVGELAAAGRDVTLDLIGAGPEREALERQVREGGLGDRVIFHGSLGEDQVIQHLRRADAFVLASRAEPLGVAYMEAMALELPTIGTAAGGVGEIITDGVDGLLVPPGDPRALAAAIVRVMDNTELAERLGCTGRRTIISRFDSRLGAAVVYERLFGHPPLSLAPLAAPATALLA